MKTIRNSANKDGSRTVTINIKPNEMVILTKDGVAFAMNSNVDHIPIDPKYHYRLGGQVDDIVAAHVITEAAKVFWCSIEQKWRDV